MIQAHRLIENLSWNQRNNAIETPVDDLRRAVKFQLPTPPSHDHEVECEVAATVETLHEHGMLKLPYPVCYLETFIPVNAVQPLKEATGGDAPAMVRFGVLATTEEDTGKGIGLVGFLETKFMPTMQPWECLFTQGRPGEMLGLGMNREILDLDKDGGRVAAHVITEGMRITLGWFFFVLNARGTCKAHYAAPTKLNKTRVSARKEPIDAYTEVLLPNWRQRRAEDQEAQRQGYTIEERKRPRMHWRRGHMRNQAYGPGRTEHKPVFIQPQMIGYEEDGQVFHLQYGQGLPK